MTTACTDTVGTAYQIIGFNSNGNSNNSQTVAISAGYAPSSGANTVSCATANENAYNLYELSGAVADYSNTVVKGLALSSNPQTIGSGTLTTLVPNELLIGVAGVYRQASNTAAFQSPFTSVNSTNVGTGYEAASSVTGYSVNVICTGCTSGDAYAEVLVGIRPAANAAAPPTGGRNKAHVIRRRIPWDRPRKVLELEKT